MKKSFVVGEKVACYNYTKNYGIVARVDSKGVMVTHSTGPSHENGSNNYWYHPKQLRHLKTNSKLK